LLTDVREAVLQQRGARRIDLSQRVAHALLRCVQEAVTNSVRHARAARVAVVLGVDGAS